MQGLCEPATEKSGCAIRQLSKLHGECPPSMLHSALPLHYAKPPVLTAYALYRAIYMFNRQNTSSVSLFFLQDKTYVVSINFLLNVLRAKQIFGLNVL